MDYTPKLISFGHQVEALKRIASRPTSPSDADAFALLMDMGTGKTKVILDEWGARVAAGDLENLLVVAPAGSYRNWAVDRDAVLLSEVTKNLPDSLREKVVTHTWESGRVSARREADAFLKVRGRPRVLVVNVEALSSVERAREMCGEFIASGRTMMAVDESTTIKNYSAARTKAVWRLGDAAAARRIMTGLVAPKSPLDLYAQFAFLDWRIIGLRSYFAFRARYAVMQKMWTGGRSIEIVAGYKNVDDLQQRVAPYSFRVTKEQCLDLPEKIYTSRDVELTEEQVHLYKEIRDNATAQLASGEYVTATEVIVQILRLHQLLCGHLVDENGQRHDVPSRRLDALMDILEDHSGKAIVWVCYDHSVRQVAERLRTEYGPKAVACFWGGNRGERGEDERKFTGDPDCRFMVATPASGGRGNNWVQATLVVYYANTYDLEMRQQSEDRSHRSGQTSHVTYVDMVARGTVDERILSALRGKIDLASAIAGDGYRKWLI